MSPFLPVRVSALGNRLTANASLVNVAYLASEEFVDRSELRGPSRMAERLAVTHYLLKRIALAPNDLALVEEQLADGLVNLQYFGVANPVPLFLLDVESAEHAQLLEAIEENKRSRMFNAALRVLRHRTSKKVAARSRREDALMGQLRDTLRWPTAEDFRKNPENAGEIHAQNASVLDARRRAIRALRHDRLACLERVTWTYRCWTELLEDVAINVFCATLH